jgi:serine/threonine protein kinase
MDPATADAFRGTDRYEVLRCLGAGGMGVVYEAIDRSSHTRVALKTLANLDAAAVYRFKKEFRALADLAHPNLVRLHELVAQPEGCFFTMELITGVELLDHVAPRTSPVTHDSQPIGEVSTVDGWHPATSSVEAAAPAEPSSRRKADFSRLRAALPQLVLGLDALHAAGKLHRDVKPSNIMVTATGRLVLLDFGIVADAREQRATDVNVVVGTPMYMSPEQAASMELSPATDWYALGVVLYEALTGRLPFVGAPMRVLMEKQEKEAPPPNQVVEGVPDDLNDLCVELLRTRAEDRPRCAEILRRLGIDRDLATSVVHDTWKTAVAPFIGRDALLETLAEAFESSRQGESEVVFVRGESGADRTRKSLSPSSEIGF